jgi:hypothetical protein
MISGAARELFEELGVLWFAAATRSRKVNAFHCSTISNRNACRGRRCLKHYELYLDADDFTYVGRWVTPPFNAVVLIRGSFW